MQAYFEYNPVQQVTYKIERVDGEPIYIAGLWDIWIDIKTSILIPTFVMITVPPNAAIAAIHDRMLAMIERADIKS